MRVGPQVVHGADDMERCASLRVPSHTQKSTIFCPVQIRISVCVHGKKKKEKDGDLGVTPPKSKLVSDNPTGIVACRLIFG